MQVAPQRGDLQLLSLLTATLFTRSFYAKNSSSLHLLIFQRSQQSETSNRKLNLRLQMFKEKIERVYVETLRRDGVISTELLKNHLQRINSVPAMLLEASRTELQSIEACIGKSKSKSTYRNNFYCDKKLSHFVSNKSKIDVPISILSIAFFDEYRFHLKKKRVMLLLPSTSIFAG